MMWYIYNTTKHGRFLANYFGFRTKREAEHYAAMFRKIPENIKVEVVKK